MKLQLIASEVIQIPSQMEEVRASFNESQQIKKVDSEKDIDSLYKLLASGLSTAHLKIFEKVGLTNIESQVRIAKPHYDPNSVFDNFI